MVTSRSAILVAIAEKSSWSARKLRSYHPRIKAGTRRSGIKREWRCPMAWRTVAAADPASNANTIQKRTPKGSAGPAAVWSEVR
jgi:hypothetical protein